MMGLSFGHLLIVLVIVLLMSTRRLPGLGTALGRAARSFKEGLEDSKDETKKKDSDSHR